MKSFPLVSLLLLLLFSACSHPQNKEKRHPPRRVEVAPPPTYHTPLIVLDPGHGGEDHGTESSKHKYKEKEFTLATSQMLKRYLENRGHQVVMTRTTDIFIELKDRARFANERKPKLFISVHYNSAPSAEAHGIEVFYYKSEKDPKRSKESRLLADAVLKSMLQTTGAKSRGVKHGNFAVIRETNMTAILIEAGFLTNVQERTKLRDPTYQRHIAYGIAQGVTNYLNK